LYDIPLHKTFELDEDTTAELELGTDDELLGFELDEDALEELETTDELLNGMLELLGFELDEDTAAELETADELLDRTLELLAITTLDEEITAEFELGSTGSKFII